MAGNLYPTKTRASGGGLTAAAANGGVSTQPVGAPVVSDPGPSATSASGQIGGGASPVGASPSAPVGAATSPSAAAPESGVGLTAMAAQGTTPPDLTAGFKYGGPDAVTRAVGEDELVSFQLGKLLSSDNPLMQRAKAEALAQANSRGLANSTMAVTAGEDAMLKNAMPIATADAATYGKTASENMAATNTSRIADKSGFYNFQTAGLQGLTQKQISDADNAAALERARLAEAGATERASMGIASQEKLSANEIASREKITDKEITAAADRLTKELGSREKISAMEIRAAADRLKAELASRANLTAMEIQGAADRLTRELTARAAMQTEQLQSQEKVAQAEIDARKQMNDDELALRNKLAQADISSREKLAENELAFRDEWAKADNQTRLDIAQKQIDANALLKQMEIDASAKQQLASLDQNAFVNYMRAVSEIQAGQGDEAAKKKAVENLTAMYAGSAYKGTITFADPGAGAGSGSDPGTGSSSGSGSGSSSASSGQDPNAVGSEYPGY